MSTPMTHDALQWSIPANLRWLAENIDAPRIPCGMLTGRFLISIAERFEFDAALNHALPPIAETKE